MKNSKFGGFAQQCELILESHTSETLNSCLSARLDFGLGGGLGLNIFDAEVCNGYTSDGKSSSLWTSNVFESTESWEGGSIQTAPHIRSGNFSAWALDVQQNPRSVPTLLSSIPELFRGISGAYSLSPEFCRPCAYLKDAGLTQATLDARIMKLEEAFVEHLYKGLETKFAAEDVCGLSCGTCGSPPLEDCSCPVADLTVCQFEAHEVVDAYIGSIEFAVDFIALGQSMRMSLEGLGEPYDASKTKGGKREISYRVEGDFTFQVGDFLLIEVVQGESKFKAFNSCVGGIKFPVAKIGSGQELSMTESCRKGYGRRGRDPRVLINGRVSFPHCCTCESYETTGQSPTGGLVKKWMLIFIISGAVVICCACCGFVAWAKNN